MERTWRQSGEKALQLITRISDHVTPDPHYNRHMRGEKKTHKKKSHKNKTNFLRWKPWCPYLREVSLQHSFCRHSLHLTFVLPHLHPCPSLWGMESLFNSCHVIQCGTLWLISSSCKRNIWLYLQNDDSIISSLHGSDSLQVEKVD